jgi:hypothetical protein
MQRQGSNMSSNSGSTPRAPTKMTADQIARAQLAATAARLASSVPRLTSSDHGQSESPPPSDSSPSRRKISASEPGTHAFLRRQLGGMLRPTSSDRSRQSSISQLSHSAPVDDHSESSDGNSAPTDPETFRNAIKEAVLRLKDNTGQEDAVTGQCAPAADPEGIVPDQIVEDTEPTAGTARGRKRHEETTDLVSCRWKIQLYRAILKQAGANE